MPVAVGLDASGNATPALLKKLAALGADASCVTNLRRENDGKAEILFYDSQAKGATLAEGLQKAIEAATRRTADPQGHDLPIAGTAGAASISSARRMAWSLCMAAMSYRSPCSA